MVDPATILLASSLITMQNLVVVFHTVRARRRSQNFGDTEARLLQMG